MLWRNRGIGINIEVVLWGNDPGSEGEGMGGIKLEPNLKAKWDVEASSCQRELLIISGKSGLLHSLSRMTAAKIKGLAEA